MAYYKEHVWAEVLFEVMACILREDDYKKVQKLLTASEAGELAGNLSDPIPKDWMLGIFGQLYPFMQLYNPPSWDKWDRFYEGLYPLMTAHLDLITENKDLNQYLPQPHRSSWLRLDKLHSVKQVKLTYHVHHPLSVRFWAW